MLFSAYSIRTLPDSTYSSRYSSTARYSSVTCSSLARPRETTVWLVITMRRKPAAFNKLSAPGTSSYITIREASVRRRYSISTPSRSRKTAPLLPEPQEAA